MTTDRPYITKTWLIGILVAIMLSSGGWVIRMFEKTDDSLLNRLQVVEARTVEVAARQTAQNDEVIRRLKRIEDGQDRLLERLQARPSRSPQVP